MENPLENLDWDLLRKQKARVINLIYVNNYTSQEDADAFEGILNLINSIQDYAVDELGIDENIVFKLENNEQ